jgi:AcrR family transcriptional regulator
LAKGKEAVEPARVRVPNTERSSRTRHKIQKAAVDRFYRDGFARTTVDDIVVEAGVTKGAFYHHFRSKNEVLARIQEDLLNQQLERFEQVIRSHDTASDRLMALVATIIRTAVEDRAAVTVWSREHENLEPDHSTPILALRERLDAVVADTIAEGVASGEFRQSGPARVLAFGIVGMCTWVQEWFSQRGELSVDEIAELYGRLLLDGLRAD